MTEIQTIEHLTAIETNYLAEYEQTIESGLRTFYAVGAALVAIRQQRLYRATHGTFEAYCNERWGISKTNANRLITAADVVNDVTPIGVIPANEAQARPLAPLPPEQRREVWSKAVEASNGKPTARDVERAAAAVKPPSMDDIRRLKAEVRRLGGTWHGYADNRFHVGFIGMKAEFYLAYELQRVIDGINRLKQAEPEAAPVAAAPVAAARHPADWDAITARLGDIGMLSMNDQGMFYLDVPGTPQVCFDHENAHVRWRLTKEYIARLTPRETILPVSADEEDSIVTAFSLPAVPVDTAGRNKNIVPHALMIGIQSNPYELATVWREDILWHTPETVRLQGKMQHTTNQSHVICLPSDEAYDQALSAHADLQDALSALASALREIGSYSRKLEQSAPGEPNPLTPTVIDIEDPDHPHSYNITEMGVPSISRCTIHRHTPKMLELEEGYGRVFQNGYFICPTNDDWERINALHGRAAAAAEAWQHMITRLGTYREALADGRYTQAQATLPNSWRMERSGARWCATSIVMGTRTQVYDSEVEAIIEAIYIEALKAQAEAAGFRCMFDQLGQVHITRSFRRRDLDTWLRSIEGANDTESGESSHSGL